MVICKHHAELQSMFAVEYFLEILHDYTDELILHDYTDELSTNVSAFRKRFRISV